MSRRVTKLKVYGIGSNAEECKEDARILAGNFFEEGFTELAFSYGEATIESRSLDGSISIYSLPTAVEAVYLDGGSTARD